jgi:hypothetical protein
MKKIFANASFAIAMLALSLVFSTQGMRAGDFVLFSKTLSSVHFTITIPDQWNNSIVQEATDDATYFKFKKSDGTKEFLFSICKISAQQWLAIKDQLTNVKMIDRKGDTIYYAQYSDKEKIKGAGNEEYAKIYSHLNEIISSVKITD